MSRQVFLKRLPILSLLRSKVVVADNHASGLNAVDMVVHFAQVPIEIGRLVPLPVKPDSTDLAVIGQQLRELIYHKLLIRFPVSLLGAPHSAACAPDGEIIGTAPIELRIIKMQLDALFMAFIGQFFDDIALKRRAVNDVVRRLLGVEHRKAVVVARRDANVFRSGGFHIGHPFRCVVFRRIKPVGQLGVLLPVDVFVVHDPLAVGHHAVNAPVNEHAEFHVLKLRPVFQVFGRGHVFLLCQ